MPILPMEPDVYPDELLEQFDGLESPDAQWWAIYTRARREKELMRRLRGLQVPFYGPLAPRKTRSAHGRTRVSHIPLFPGYVFVWGDLEQRRLALTTNCVSKVLLVPDAKELVRDLRQIRRLILSDAPMTAEARLQPGMRVRVRSGVLSGLEGVVLKRRGKDRLLVAVEFLQQGASIALDDFEVELLG
jgi:transcriptional antiterminator RfaH